ncbi:MAG: murein biosynthesis integral membrane protein MurJ [Deltaproteobacteria bacterium]|nr:murein biosynthesis integral membrane protein MurJ [Deltaproteobacteria bacterium]
MPDQQLTVEGRAITKRAAIVASGTLSSRVLGAIRDAVIAASFSIGATDAFFVAFTIPNALRALLAEGAVSNAFIPVFSEVSERAGPERAREFYAALTGVMVLILVAVSVLGVLIAPQLVTLYAAGYKSEPEKFAATVEIARVVFPYILFMGIAALGMAALNTLKRFFVPAFAPALLNLSMISAPFFFTPLALLLDLSPIVGLALAALFGGFLQAVVQIPALARVGMLIRPRINFRDPAVIKVLRLMTPLMLGVGIYEINILLSRLFASYLPSGSQSFLYYGQRLVEIPQGMFALALATATLPSLATLRNRGRHDEAKETFCYSFRLSLFISVPASVAIAVLAVPIVTVVFGRGAFRTDVVMETARSLVWMALGVWAIASVRNTIQMFFAYNDTRTPVICSGLNLVVFATLSLTLSGPMRHMGIAAATSAAAFFQLVALLLLLARRIGRFDFRSLFFCALRCAAMSSVMALALFEIASFGNWDRGGNDPANIGLFIISIITGIAVYFFLAYLIRAPELFELWAAIRSKEKARSRAGS